MAGPDERTEWLSLIDVSGPFLAPAVLEEVFPQGLDKVETPRRRRIRAAYEEWQDAVDDDDPRLADLHGAWTRIVLEEALEYEDAILIPRGDGTAGLSYSAPEHGASVEPDYAVRSDDGALRLLVAVHPPGTDLDRPSPGDRWPASPAEKMTLLCRANGVRLGLVTDGEQWMLVNAPIGGTSGYATWFARLWWQEPVTFKAFVSLLGVRRCFGPPEGRLDQMLERSLGFQEEVTDTLGEQVRRAVEVLVQALGRADQDRDGELLKDVSPAVLFEAGLTIMMRLVFVLCAEERRLLLLGDPTYDQHYAISTLRARLREDADRLGLEVLERRHDAWSRMLATFRAVYGGIDHEAMRLPALGGSLFDPDRFPFLEGRPSGTSWRNTPANPLPIDNRTSLLLLEALQILEQTRGARLLSYRALDVEQIGHVYEGLLEYTVAKVAEASLGLIGSKKASHPIIALRELEALQARGTAAAAAELAEITGRNATTLKNALARAADESALPRLVQACGGDEKLVRRVLPFAELVRPDSWGTPVIYRKGTFAVTPGPTRRETGTHYTPKVLTQTIVEKTLGPVVYVGAAEGEPPEKWRLRSPSELLDLKICDPAMGSGAFLVQACRYLAERLVESWGREEEAGRTVTVDGKVGDSSGGAECLPAGTDERLVIARRLVAERCLYGVDVNPLAVELAKLSIWLVTLAKGRPFGFLDHNLRCGDSLLGIHRLEQLIALDMDPSRKGRQGRLFGKGIEKAVEAAVELRSRLRQRPIRDIRDVEAMERLNEQARGITERPALIADAFVCEVLRYTGNNRAAEAPQSVAVAADHALGGTANGEGELRDMLRISLFAGLPASRPSRRPFHWPLEFPEVFVRPRPGFDAVVGNPPFLNAIENAELRDDLLRGYYSTVFQPFASGAYDLCLLFWARTLQHILRNDGCYGLLSPTVLLSDTSAWKRWMHERWRPTFLRLNPVDLFARVRIRTTAICGTEGTATAVEVLNRDTQAAQGLAKLQWREDSLNWYEAIHTPRSSASQRAKRESVPLSDVANVAAGCTTADAYNLQPMIEDEMEGDGLKLMTTGAIDRYVSKWGRMRIRYLKQDYNHPRWPVVANDRGVDRARNKQAGPKILVGGLTAVIEAWFDQRGEAGGVVQVWVITPKKSPDNALCWYTLLTGILNSATFSRLFVQRHGAAAMSGKQITVKKKSLLEMSIPALPSPNDRGLGLEMSAVPPQEAWASERASSMVAALLSRAVMELLASEPSDSRFGSLDKLAHLLCGGLYGLSPEDSQEDYAWWCDRSGVQPCEVPVGDLIQELRQSIVPRKTK